jgi:hypothetical protein
VTVKTDRDLGGSTATPTREQERPAPTKARPQVVRWIELLAFLAVAAVAAVGLWLLVGDQATDGSFETAEEARFARIGQAAQLITVQELAALEDAVTPSVGAPFEAAEMSRFERIAEAAGVPTLLSDGSSAFAELMRMEQLRPDSTLHLDGFDLAETMRFYRIGGYEPAITLDEFVEP